MVAFLIDPEIRIRHQRYPILRTIADAAEFARSMTEKHPRTAWSRVARNLERVRTEDDAVEAAVELEMLLKREAMLIPDAEEATLIPSSRVPESASPPALVQALSVAHAAAPVSSGR